MSSPVAVVCSVSNVSSPTALSGCKPSSPRSAGDCRIVSGGNSITSVGVDGGGAETRFTCGMSCVFPLGAVLSCLSDMLLPAGRTLAARPPPVYAYARIMATITTVEFSIDGLGDKLHVARFRGTEEVSSLYCFEVEVVCENHELAFDDMVGAKAVLTMNAAERQEDRYLHGVISDFEQGAEGPRLSLYRAVVVPDVWRLDQKQDFRIFQEMSTPEIIEQVLGDAGISDFESRLQASYRKHEYRVQYRESDWAFILRLMEEEGILCYFEHEQSKHTLVFGDSPSSHTPIVGDPTIIFRPPGGALISTEHVAKFRYRQTVRPGKVTLRDYDFKRPDLDLESAAEGEKDGVIEVYDYPGEYHEPADGSTLATRRLERWEAVRRTAHAESGCMRLATGQTFNLSEHARGDFNRGYMITHIDHECTQPVGDHSDIKMKYANRFVCMPDDLPYRPPHRTPKPKIYGVQTAIVVGPAGEEIYPDEHGRVKVQFHWDREGKNDENSSCWIRVSQVWAGAGWGAMQIPRIGQEVVVDFLEGDPDRPLIVGRVYHGANVPPYRLPAEKTKSTLKSESSLGGGGSNELMFEDAKGDEEIYLHGQKDWTIKIENDKNQDVGHDETHHVGNDRSKTVDNNQLEKIGNNKTIEVGGSHKETIALAESITVGLASTHKVGGALSETVGAAKTSTVGGILSQKVGANMTVKVGGKKDQTVGGDFKEGIEGDLEQTVGGKRQLSIDAESIIKIGKKADEEVGTVKSITVGDEYSLEVGKGKLTIKKNGDIELSGKKLIIKGTGPIQVEGAKLQVKSDGKIDVKASGAIKVKGSSVGIN